MEGIGLAQHSDADVFLRLPHAERGTLRIGDHRHAAVVHHVERILQDGAPERLRLLGGGVRVLHADVAGPGGWHAHLLHLGIERVERRHVLPLAGEDRVDAFGAHVRVLELPVE